jgi:hypothetical protein
MKARLLGLNTKDCGGGAWAQGSKQWGTQGSGERD